MAAHSLLLRLAGPMQAWGDDSRYRVRRTGQIPTKSGVVGLLAAALGRRRGESLEDLAALGFAVRVDQPGTPLSDYQTADGDFAVRADTRLMTKHYLCDAAFIAAVESTDRGRLEELDRALDRPRFPLFLGRRSCPAPPRLGLGVRDVGAVDALLEEDWHASDWYKRAAYRSVSLPIYRDARPGERGAARRDVPVSFAPNDRRYEWRRVVLDDREKIIDNDQGRGEDPFFKEVLES